MLCSYGFILQLTRSPTPCCVGNGTLITLVHRGYLTCEQQTAKSCCFRASSSRYAFVVNLALFLWFPLTNQSIAESQYLSTRGRGHYPMGWVEFTSEEGKNTLQILLKSTAVPCCWPPPPQSLQHEKEYFLPVTQHFSLLLFNFLYTVPRNKISLKGLLLAKPAGAIIAVKLCSGQLKRREQCYSLLFSTLSGFFLQLWICCHQRLMIPLTPLSENEFFTPHLIDSIHSI